MAWNWLSDRNPGYQKIAQRLGLDYEEKDQDKEILRAHKGYHLFKTGSNKKVKYILSGLLESKEPFRVFEYSFAVSTGKSTTVFTQHVLSVRLKKSLPPFTLRPENLFHKIGEWLGWKDIDFDAFPDFSKQYRLMSGKESSVRKVFNDHILGFLSFEKGWWVECDGPTIIYFKHSKRMNEEMVEPFIQVSQTMHYFLTGFKGIR
ncbi:MAG TPA: hypothetical protein PKM27_10180 [Saprospiraceae bacterium]|nr:hypothetical protein [Saprospiraceae bacterium]HNT19741.1 hypothetical protein [Saprospiraceae bacterium]